MTGYDDARENVVWGAADAFLSNNLDEILDEVFERVDEDGDDPEDVVEDVVSDWISRISISDEVREYIYEQIDNETIYTDDCITSAQGGPGGGGTGAEREQGDRLHQSLCPVLTPHSQRLLAGQKS